MSNKIVKACIETTGTTLANRLGLPRGVRLRITMHEPATIEDSMLIEVFAPEGVMTVEELQASLSPQSLPDLAAFPSALLR